jgi:hypothetical protein
MDELPDPSTLDDDELREQIRGVKSEEAQLSYRRRFLHGRIDVVRSEMLLRIDRAGGGTGELDDLVARLTRVLTHQGPPPLADELERFGASGEVEVDAEMGRLADQELLPELSELSDAELAGLVHALTDRERRTSARRQELHRAIDRLRQVHIARLQERYASEAGADA